MDLKSEITAFQRWSVERHRSPERCHESDSEYPDWASLYAAAESTFGKPVLDDVDIDLLLYALAHDNDSEHIRELLGDFPSHGLRVATSALAYPDADARWQAADFLGLLDLPEAQEVLRRFVTDPDEYVRRRAILAALTHDSVFAEETAWGWVGSPDDYSRLVALDILHRLDSPLLRQALMVLQNDPFEFVQRKIAEIERGS